ncbi:hypothetical protein SDC9_60941 [bioreactor metagenome]|uniref:Uncharacterized protein n=1 Tax=bioreactor metagenome TaxID=1076179 RepID=A0A644XF82_9ZZZZ
MAKKLTSLALALVMCLSLCVPAFAYNREESFDEKTYFVPMTREEYITSKATSQNMSYEAAAAELDEKIANAIAEIPSVRVWDPDTTVDNGDTTYTSYGRIYKVYTHASGLKMRYSAEAVKLRSTQGANWIEVNENSAWCQPEGSGNHNFIGNPTAKLLSNTQIRLAVTRYFEIAESTAISSGINLEFFSSSVSVGGTTYYRDNVNTSHIERA